jgi:hypothetical protein
MSNVSGIASASSASAAELICVRLPSWKTGAFGAHIARMPEYVDEAFVVLVHVLLDSGERQRERYVIGCPTREEAEAKIRDLHPPESHIKLFALPLSAAETKALNLTAYEFRPWQ